MDVRLPDGTIITNVPEGTTQSELMRRVGLMAEPTKKEIPERTYGEAATDIGAKLVSGLGSLIQQPGQLMGLATGAIKDKDFGTTGVQGVGKEMQEWAKERTSKALLAKEAETARLAEEAEKTGGQWAAFKSQAGSMLSDPAQLTAFLAEQTPQAIPSIIAALIPGAGPAISAELRAAQVAAKSATTVAAREAAELAVADAIKKATASQVARGAAAAKGVGAVQQGADIGGGSYEEIYKKLIEGGASEADAANQALNLARAAGVGGGALSLLAAKLPGAQAFERALAGERIGAKGALGRAAAIGAGALKEIPGEEFEEVGGKLLQNLAMQQVSPEQSLTSGLGVTAAQAAIGAAGLGGAGGALSGRRVEDAETPPAKPKEVVDLGVTKPSPMQVVEERATELERQQQKQDAAMERAREIGIGGGSEVNQTLLDQARIRKEQQERADAAQEKAAEDERKKELRAERVRIGSAQYSGDKMMNEVLRSRAVAEFDAANAPKVEAPKIPEYQPTKTIEQTTPVEQPEGFNVLRGMDARNADLMSAMSERRAAEEATAAAKAKEVEAKKAQEIAKIDTSRADVDQRVAQVENFLMSTAKKTQQETADYMAGVVPEMRKDFLALLDEDMSKPLTLEQTEALKTQIRQRLQPDVAAEETVQRTPFKKFLAAQGMNKQDVQDIFGENAYRANQQLPGSVRADAPRLDMLAEAAVEAGFLQEEDTDALTQMIKDEFGGDEQVAVDMADERAAAEYEAQRENELESRAGAIGLDTKGMKPEQIAARLDRIERKREEKRKQYNRDVDGFADLPTLEQDRIIDMMIDRFGEPQVYDVERAEQEGEVDQVDDAVKEAIAAERPDDIRYKRATGKVGIGKQAVQDTVDTVKARWANAPEVVVAESMDDPAIPQEVRNHNKEAVANGAKGKPQGFYYKGKAYVIADSIGSTNEAVEALMHEALGHYGLRGVFGPKMEAVLRDVIKNRRAEVEGKAEKYGLDINNDADMLEAAEEVLAVMAQTKPGLPFVKRAIAVIRNFLRDLGFDIKMSDADLIEKYILPAQAFVERGKGRSIEGKPATMRGEAQPEEVRYSRQATKLTPTQAAEENLAILEATGMQLQPPEPGRIQKIKDTLRAAGENPELTKASAKATITKFLDKMEVAAFSGDAAFNNDIRRNLEKDFADNPEILGLLLEASQSQAVHSDALATRFIVDGGIAYDKETKKWVSIKKEDNFIKLAKQIEKAAEKYGLSKEQTEQIAHTYFVAKRFEDLLKKQNNRDAEIERLQDELAAENENIKQYKKDGDFEKLRTSERAKNDIKADIKKLEKAEVLISDDQRAMIEPGLSLVKNMPELEDISDTWQGIRANAVKAMVDGGLWSMEYSEIMLNEAAYVPFYRDEQLDAGGGPQEFIKGLEVKGKEYRLKGSNAAVNDIFDNMVRWTQYAINRSVRNHKALQMVDIGTDLQVGDRKMAEKVEKMDPKKNTIRVFRNGTQEIYSMADPLYVDAFASISNVAIPSLKFFTWFSNVLRQSVVLYPLFSVAQVPQDSFSAMFSSGLKTRFALRIPVLAVKEFVKTIAKTSSTHNLLASYGATGVRDFNAEVARQDIQIAAGLKSAKGLGGKSLEFLSHIAMAADNSVRQAVYEASMQQGLSKSEAIEKAFDIINFRRRGTSKMINLMGQVVPFFYAYMSVQRTAYKTLTGVGISPQKRSEALTTLATTSGAVMALSLLYAMANGGDDEYEKTPTAVRDRTLNIPGTGVRIPLRPDLFLMPKVITEHVYHLLMEDGFSDSAKFKKSLSEGLANAVLSPQPIPQAVKPAFEVAINYDFFQGRPLIGQFEKQKEAERQFNDNTSEFSKLLGNFGASPIAADHLIRGMFGTAGGLFLYMTNFMINSDPDVPRPEMSFQEALAALPGTSGFVTKPNENALKNDFYALRDEVEKVKNTYNDIKMRSPQELEQFLADEKNIAQLGLAKSTEKIGAQVSKIRRAITQISNAPEDLYSASEKREAIKELRDVEREMFKSIDVPALRKMAMM